MFLNLKFNFQMWENEIITLSLRGSTDFMGVYQPFREAENSNKETPLRFKPTFQLEMQLQNLHFSQKNDIIYLEGERKRKKRKRNSLQNLHFSQKNDIMYIEGKENEEKII